MHLCFNTPNTLHYTAIHYTVTRCHHCSAQFATTAFQAGKWLKVCGGRHTAHKSFHSSSATIVTTMIVILLNIWSPSPPSDNKFLLNSHDTDCVWILNWEILHDNSLVQRGLQTGISHKHVKELTNMSSNYCESEEFYFPSNSVWCGKAFVPDQWWLNPGAIFPCDGLRVWRVECTLHRPPNFWKAFWYISPNVVPLSDWARCPQCIALHLDHSDGHFFSAMEWLMFFFRPPLTTMVFQWF